MRPSMAEPISRVRPAPNENAARIAPDPNRVFDVANVQPSELERLRRSQPHLADTIARAKEAYGGLQGARVLVTTSAGNGGMPVVTIVPPGFDPNKPARVHTHYHGDLATAADRHGSPAGTTERVKELMQRYPQTVFVLPESAPPTGGYANWSRVRSQAETARDALRAAGISGENVESIVSAHSRGGNALVNAMRTREGIRADRIELLDPMAGRESAITSWFRTADAQRVKSVVFVHSSDPASAGEPIRGAIGSRYRAIAALDHFSAVRRGMGVSYGA